MKVISYYFPIIVLCSFFYACQQTSPLEKLLEVKVSSQYLHNKTIEDVKDHYQITIGDHWKRELYFDDHLSRIYAADTTKNFLSSFIVDVNEFKGDLKIDKDFKDGLIKQISSQPRSFIIQKGDIEINNLPGYCVFSFTREPDFEVYNLICYLNEKEHYFMLTSTMYGSDFMKENLKESVKIFNSLTLLNQQ